MGSMVKRTGFLIVGIGDTKISKAEQKFLERPEVAGVILSKHNYHDKSQITELIEALHGIKPGFIVSADHECGIVQRFEEGFTKLPIPMEIGRHYDEDKDAALKTAYAYGVVVGAEMREINMDLSYLPVMDVAYSMNSENLTGAIKERAFHSDPEAVTELSKAVVTGLHNSSLPACGKHFPGHGSVRGDTHTDITRDSRTRPEIEAHDLYPFADMIEKKYLDCIMLSHIVYEAINDTPASLSEHWIKVVLREQLGFDGIVCTDDLDMKGISDVNSAMLKKAMDAGCNLLLICWRKVPKLEQLMSDFSDDEIDHYNRLSSEHLGVIDTHIHNRIPQGSDAYEKAVAIINNFNNRVG